jgi:hypothetical protein
MPSGAGLNRGGVLGGITLLSVAPTAALVAAPTAAYGTIGLNDSGGLLHTLAGFTKWRFQIIGAGATTAGYSISIYGTLDPALLNYVYQQGPHSGLPMDTCAVTAIPATSWQLVDSPSDQSGTGVVANPMVTGASTTCASNTGWYAVRAVLTATASPTLPITVLASAVP